MVIVCTQDSNIISFAQSPDSGASQWGNVIVLSAAADMAAAIAQLQTSEPLCLCAHGNNTEIGDAESGGWGWDYTAIANILIANAPTGLPTVLIYACATSVANFSAALAVQLQSDQAFNGLWCYGWNTPLTIGTTFPGPSQQTLGQQVYLQGSQVNFGAIRRTFDRGARRRVSGPRKRHHMHQAVSL
jgi:hypothetical protein